MVTHIFRCFYIAKLPKQPAIQIHFGIKIARQNHSLLAMYRGDVIIHFSKKKHRSRLAKYQVVM